MAKSRLSGPGVGTLPIPTPDKDQLLVKIHSAALNPVDPYMAFTGFEVHSYPAVFGHDGAGVVEEVGANVKNFVKGDKV